MPQIIITADCEAEIPVGIDLLTLKISPETKNAICANQI